MQQHIFSFVSELDELQNSTPLPASSHCSSVQERLANYGSEALDTAEHLGLIVGSQKAADALLSHFGSLTVIARASVQELLPFVSRPKALRLVSSLRMGAVALREERQSLTIDSPLAIADLCSEMRFLDREFLRVALLNAKQQLIKAATVSQGSVNESLAHPREVFKPAIVHSAYSFVMVHNHPSGDPSPSEADMRLTRRILEAAESCSSLYLITLSSAHPLRAGAAISASKRVASFPDAFLASANSPYPLTKPWHVAMIVHCKKGWRQKLRLA